MDNSGMKDWAMSYSYFWEFSILRWFWAAAAAGCAASAAYPAIADIELPSSLI